MGDLNLLAEWTNQTETSGSVNVTLLYIVDAEINWIVATGQKMTKLSGLSILKVDQGENIVKYGWSGTWRYRVFLRGQSFSQKTRDMYKLRKRKLRIWVDPPP